MTLIPVNNVGQYGVLADLQDFTIPVNAWTSGENVRFNKGLAHKFKGEQTVYSGASVAPYWALPVATEGTLYILYGGLTAAAQWNGSTHTTVTRTIGGAYSTDQTILWNGGVLNGIAVINNGIDVPQFWATTGTGTLENLTNWPATHKCKVIAPFKNFLVALNIDISGTVFPHRVLWSHSADPGTIPSSWDVADATKDAGQVDLADVNSGVLEAALQLGDQLILYKSNAVWNMRYVGGNSIFSFHQMFSTFGAINARCVLNVPRGVTQQTQRHFIATGDDLLIHDGQSVRSVLNRAWRDYITGTISTEHWQRSFVCLNVPETEVWFCFPEEGETTCTKAIVWNYSDETIGLRDLNNITYAIDTYIDDSASMGQDWGSDTEAWGDDSTIWNAGVFSSTKKGLLMAQPGSTAFLQADQTNQYKGVNFSSSLERTGLAIVGYDREGRPQIDVDQRKLLKRVWPKMKGGGTVTIKGIVQDDIQDMARYTDGVVFQPGTGQLYVDFDPPISGRYVGFSIESNGNTDWSIQGYELDIELLGTY